MEITYDPAKDEINVAKHACSLTLAAEIDWPYVMVAVDARTDYLEVREIGFAPIQNRLYCVVFTQRDDAMHIISLRKANKREVKDYDDQS